MSESTHPADESNDGARIDTTRDAMRQALEALELARDYAEGERLENERRYRGHEHLAPDDAYAVGQIDAAIAALRAALAEQERGPGWCPIHQHYKPCEHNTVKQAQPTSEAGWLHRLDMEKSEAWMAGYAQGLKRAAEQAQPVACKFSRLQVRNLWNNSPEHRGDATSFAAFARIVRLVEEAHRIGDNARTPPAPVVPPGRKLVPVEPTEAMLSAAQSAWLRDPARKTTTMYRSMLAAAPEAPSPPVVPQPLAGWELARVIADAGADELAAVSGTALLRLIRAVEAEVLKRVGVQR